MRDMENELLSQMGYSTFEEPADSHVINTVPVIQPTGQPTVHSQPPPNYPVRTADPISSPAECAECYRRAKFGTDIPCNEEACKQLMNSMVKCEPCKQMIDRMIRRGVLRYLVGLVGIALLGYLIYRAFQPRQVVVQQPTYPGAYPMNAPPIPAYNPTGGASLIPK